MITDVIKLDMHRQSSYPVVYAKQYDTLQRKIIIELLDNGTEYELEGTFGKDYTVTLRYTKPDGKQGMLDYVIEDEHLCVYPTDQVLCVDGRVVCDVAIYRNSNNSLISSMTFFINVAKSAFDENKAVSSDEYLALTTATNECIKATNECNNLILNYETKLRPEMQSLINQMKSYLASV